MYTYNALGNTTTSLNPFTIKDTIDITALAWNNVTEKTIKNCWKSTSILLYFSSDGIPTFSQNTVITRESTLTITNTITSRESTAIIDQENIFATTSHSTSQEGTATTHQKSSTINNLENSTTTIQNDIITINQYGTITEIQNSTITTLNENENEIQLARQEFLIEQRKELEKIQEKINRLVLSDLFIDCLGSCFTNPISADDKKISVEEFSEFSDNEMVQSVVKEILPSIEEETEETEEEIYLNKIPSTQEVVEAFDKVLPFFERPPENFKITKEEINWIRKLHRKTKTFHLNK
ncbi:hypothetical protein Glove_84g15 [Diversispora epigaea]|uniref:Uncharacterized protein n=1 Tax=Diversispora epigaea TaxID=1348612 RepID=A0A397JI05_9GLOM|nr:hypothetical protein Glove_84g15 [Diversispora epigaea]